MARNPASDLDLAMQAIWDIRDLLQLVIDEQTIGNEEFPAGVAAAIRLTHMRAANIAALLEDAV